MTCVDGFVIPVPKKHLALCTRQARLAAKVWRKNGHLEYRECLGDDLNVKTVPPFPRLAKLKPGEVVLFPWIVFKSRAHRDRVNAKAMKDKRLLELANA